MLFVISEGGGPSDELGVVFLVAFPVRKTALARCKEREELNFKEPRNMYSAGHLYALQCVSLCHSNTRLLLV